MVKKFYTKHYIFVMETYYVSMRGEICLLTIFSDRKKWLNFKQLGLDRKKVGKTFKSILNSLFGDVEEFRNFSPKSFYYYKLGNQIVGVKRGRLSLEIKSTKEVIEKILNYFIEKEGGVC